MAAISEDSTYQLLKECASSSQSRLEFWVRFIQSTQARQMLEVGVYRGVSLSATVLERCASVNKYYMLDPWRHLEVLEQAGQSGQRSIPAVF